MRFCETNPNFSDAFSDITTYLHVLYKLIQKISIRVRLAKPNPFGKVNRSNGTYEREMEESAVYRTAATTGRRGTVRAAENLLTGGSLLTGRGVRGSKRFAVRGFKRIMRCPKCTGVDDKVIDSRTSRDGLLIRRRRECLKCGARFTTYEEIFREKLRVKKRDGQYEEFDRRKLLAGMEKACEKRPVSTEEIESLAERVVTELENEFGREVPSKQIGERIMQHLRKLDEVAYVRFASVYRQFRDAEQFIDEIKQLGKS